MGAPGFNRPEGAPLYLHSQWHLLPLYLTRSYQMKCGGWMPSQLNCNRWRFLYVFPPLAVMVFLQVYQPLQLFSWTKWKEVTSGGCLADEVMYSFPLKTRTKSESPMLHVVCPEDGGKFETYSHIPWPHIRYWASAQRFRQVLTSRNALGGRLQVPANR